MIIKKYTGKSENDAIEAAKKELGNGVVVMNVKSVKRKGLFASLRSRLVEVTVALEEEKNKDSDIAETEEKDSLIGTQMGRPATMEPRVAPQKDTQQLEQKLERLQNLLMKQMQIAQEENEIEVQEPSQKQQNDKPKEDSELVKFMKLLYNTMIDNEVDERYVNQIMEEMDKLNKPNIPIDHAIASIYQKMILKFGLPAGITPSETGPKVLVFIGPTGVGKTTTIAKIASTYTMQEGIEKKKVALLTADTYRIAAAEQLRTYANILEVPFRVIYTEEEMKAAICDYADYDYIFVDTAGHSHQNEEQLDKMKLLVDCVDEVAEKQTFLVLSATTKYKDLLRITDKYKTISNFQLIFTKLDETTSMGNILNLKLYTGTTIAYVTLGQNVPDDIEVFDPQKVVKQLLGGRK